MKAAIIFCLLGLALVEGSWILDELTEKVEKVEGDYNSLKEKLRKVVDELKEKIKEDFNAIEGDIKAEINRGLFNVSGFDEKCRSIAEQEFNRITNDVGHSQCIHKIETDTGNVAGSAVELLIHIVNRFGDLSIDASNCEQEIESGHSILNHCVVQVVEDMISSAAKDTVEVFKFVFHLKQVPSEFKNDLLHCLFDKNVYDIIAAAVQAAAACAHDIV